MISNVEHKSRRTTLMPVTIMEEVPALTTEERAEFITSLEEAEASVKADDFIEHDSKSFKKSGSLLYIEIERHDLSLVHHAARVA
jgi:hypothetical protein